MASTYPTAPRSDFLEWCQVHAPVFTAAVAEIGLSAEEALAFAEATTLAQTRSLAQEAAKETAKVATQQVVSAFDDLGNTVGNVVRTIRAYAEMSNDPNAIYAIAQIPPPAQPSPLPPPAQPTDLTVLLDPTAGTLTLHWKAKNPVGASGTSYIIRRRLPDQTEFAFIGVSGKKAFVDATLVAGPDSVQYTVQGQRGDLAGPVSPIFTVNFGKLPDGGRSATVSTAAYNPAVLNVDIPAPAGNGRTLTANR